MSKQKIALIGSEGMLGQVVLAAALGDYELTELNHPQLDFLQPQSAEAILRKIDPDIIINCAAYTAVDACEGEEEEATRINGEGPGLLARLAVENDAALMHVSTDYVFDGRKQTPYHEEDTPAPESAYGRSKLAGEKSIIESGLRRFFIIRTSWLYGPGGKNFVETILRLASEREELRIVADQFGSPTLTDDLADAMLRLLETEAYGLYHFSNEGSCTWYEFACAIVQGARERGLELQVQDIHPIATEDYPVPAPRPAYSVLSKEKYRTATGRKVPHWRDALDRYLDQRVGEKMTGNK